MGRLGFRRTGGLIPIARVQSRVFWTWIFANYCKFSMPLQRFCFKNFILSYFDQTGAWLQTKAGKGDPGTALAAPS
jgi:hypothetical protein